MELTDELHDELYNLIFNIEDSSSNYLNYDNIINDFLESFNINIGVKNLNPIPKNSSIDFIEKNILSLIFKLELKINKIVNRKNILNDFLKSLKNHSDEPKNKCLICGLDMGRTNPRQLCEKFYCPFEN